MNDQSSESHNANVTPPKVELWESHILQAHAALDREDITEAAGLISYALQEALEFGQTDPRVGHVYAQMAIIADKRGDHEAAFDHLEAACSIFQQGGADLSVSLAVALMARAGLKRTRNDLLGAEQDIVDAIKLVQEQDKSRLHEYLVVLARHYQNLDRNEEVLQVLEQVLTVQEELLDGDDQRLQGVLEALCSISDKLKDAEQSLRSGYSKSSEGKTQYFIKAMIGGLLIMMCSMF